MRVAGKCCKCKSHRKMTKADSYSFAVVVQGCLGESDKRLSDNHSNLLVYVQVLMIWYACAISYSI